MKIAGAVLSVVSLLLASEAIAGPRIGPEVSLGTPVDAPAPGNQQAPAVVWTGTNYFVVWFDEQQQDVVGARLTPDGRNLDPLGAKLVHSNVARQPLGLSWDGQNLLLVWTDTRIGPPGSDIYATRLAADGAVLDKGGFKISTAAAPAGPLIGVAWDGKEHIVGWSAYANGGTSVFGARVTAQGLVDVPPAAVTATATNKESLSMAAGGEVALFAWSQAIPPNSIFTNDLFAARLSTSGRPLDATDRVLASGPGNQGSPSLSWNGQDFLVAYFDGQVQPGSLQPSSIRGLRLAADGTVLTPGGFPLLPPGAVAGLPMALGWSGTEHLLLWRGLLPAAALYTARFPAAGMGPASSPVSLLPTSGDTEFTSLGVAAGGRQALAVWAQRSPTMNERDVVGVRIDETGRNLDPMVRPISAAANAQHEVALASNGNEFLAVWDDERVGGQVECWATRLDRDGKALDPAGIPVGLGPGVCWHAGVSWTGTEWLVAWTWSASRAQLDAELRLSHLDARGNVLGPAVLLAEHTSVRSAPGVASSGDVSFVVWPAYGTATSWDVRGARVDLAGRVLDPQGVSVSSEPLGQDEPDVVWNGETFFVVWTDDRHGSSSVYAARVDPKGNLLDPHGIPIARRSSHQSPRVAWNGSHQLVTWLDDPVAPKARAARVTREGVVVDGDGVPLPIPIGYPRRPVVAWGGHSFVVVMESGGGLGVPGSTWMLRVGADGMVIDSSPAKVVDPAFGVRSPMVAGLEDRAFIAYEVFDESLRNTRLRGRIVTEEVTPSPDAAQPDAPPDRPVADASVLLDVATPPPQDAGIDARVVTGANGGCGCRISRSTPGASGLVMVVLLVVSVRRRPSTSWRRHR